MKMIGRKLKYYQADPGEDYTSRGSLKRREEVQWRKDLEEETIDDYTETNNPLQTKEHNV